MQIALINKVNRINFTLVEMSNEINRIAFKWITFLIESISINI